MAYCHNNTAISDGQTKFFRAESFALFLKCSLGLNHRTEEELERKIKTKGRIESAWQEATADRESQTLVTDVLKESILAPEANQDLDCETSIGSIQPNR
jgi:hypothetical protein